MNAPKRSYVQVTSLPDAQTVLRLIEGWMEGCNESPPFRSEKALTTKIHRSPQPQPPEGMLKRGQN